MIDVRWKMVVGVLLAVSVLIPVGWPMANAFADIDAWHRLLADAPIMGRLLANTTLVAAGTILLSVPISTLIAVGMVRLSLVTTGPIVLLFAGILFTPLALQATAWTSLIGPYGLIDPRAWGVDSVRGRWPGLLAGIGVHGFVALPWVSATIASLLATRSAEAEIAAMIDAPLGRVFIHVTSRILLPAIPVAAGLGIVPVLTDMTVCDLFGIRTFSEEVYTQFEVAGNDHALTIAVSLLSLVGAGLLAWLSGPVLRVKAAGGLTRWQAVGVSSSLARHFLLAISTTLMLVLIAPIWALVRRLGLRSSPEGNQLSWSAEVAWDYLAQFLWTDAQAFLFDGATAGIAALLAATISLIFAWTWRFSTRSIQFVALWLAALMLLTPGPVVGISLLQIFNRDVFATIYDSRAIVAIGQCLRVLPWLFLLQIATLSRGASSPWKQLRVEGASTFQAFLWAIRTRYQSLAWASFLLGFGWCLAETATTKILAPPGVEPLPVRLFSLMHVGTGNDQAAMSLVWLGAVYVIGGIGMLRSRTPSRGQRTSA